MLQEALKNTQAVYKFKRLDKSGKFAKFVQLIGNEESGVEKDYQLTTIKKAIKAGNAKVEATKEGEFLTWEFAKEEASW